MLLIIGKVFRNLQKKIYSLSRSALGRALKVLTTEKPLVVFQDPHVVLSPSQVYFELLLKPLRNRKLKKLSRDRNVSLTELDDLAAFFYPLHSEPEVSISINGKQWQNQIELVRQIAQNLPFGAWLILKEHPRNIGYRTTSYYKKLLDIPNINFISVDTPTHLILDRVNAVFTISGIVGLEAIFRNKPTISFGKSIYSCLSEKMLMHVSDMSNLDTRLKSFLDEFEIDDYALKCYISAVVEYSVPVNFYSNVLRKNNRLSYDNTISYDEEIDILVTHFVNKELHDVAFNQKP